MIYEEALPAFDVSVQVAVVTRAEPAAAWRALDEVDLIEVGRRKPLVGALSAVRALPMVVSEVLHGRLPQRMPPRLRPRDLIDAPAGEGGWVMLGEQPGEELALGLVGKFWRPVIEFVDVSGERFREFDQPGYAKTVYSLTVEALPAGGSLLGGTMRTATTDEQARRAFRRYWTLGVGGGAHLLVNATLERAREIAESSTGPTRP